MNDLTGKTFTYWTVTSYAFRDGGAAYWHCVCKCGAMRTVRGNMLTTSRSKSCGCWRGEHIQDLLTQHGLSHNPIYFCWTTMINRCTKPTDISYRNYGAKGVTVCNRWLYGEGGKHPLTCFFEDMGERPSLDHSIDRIDGSKGYMPENCKWATTTEQRNNQCTNVRLTYNGQTLTRSQWARKFNIQAQLIKTRLDRGWTVHDALTKPKSLKGYKLYK